jgi:peptide/nickel transport system substrate-binding protein
MEERAGRKWFGRFAYSGARVRAPVGLLVSAGLVISASGCGGGGHAARPARAVDINAAPRARLKDGGTVRWAVDQFSTQWNYNQVNGPETATLVVVSGVMPRPFVADAHGRVSPDPDYVTAARVTARRHRQVVMLTLNPRARWSDGKPITWKDYEAQWKALRSPTGPFQIASSTGYERIESVDAGSTQYEVVVAFAKPFGEWRSLFTPLYPAATNSRPDAFNKGWVNKIPVTAGPFKLGGIDQTAKAVTMVRDPRWWGKPAKLASIVTRALDANAAIGAFANDEVDIADLGPDPSAVKRAQDAKGSTVREGAGPDFRQLTLNGAGPVLRDPVVRKAVAMGIDRAAITRADLAGLDWPPRTMGNHFLVNTQAGYRDNAGASGRFDPAEAGRLLDRAGWTLNGSFRQRSGRRLRLRFVLPGGSPLARNEAELVQAMLRRIGVDVTVVTVPSDAFFDRYILTGDFDIVAFGWIGTPFPISSAQSVYAKPVRDASGRLQFQQNYARIGSVAIDSLMSKAEASLVPSQALELINRADGLIWGEVHSLILFQRPQLTAVRASLANVGSFGFESPAYENIGYVR